MDFNFSFPVRVISGKGCVKNNAEIFNIGKHAFIVCGKNGAKLSGALDDVTDVLTSLNIDFTVFDKSVENPPVTICYEGGMLCREVGADFVIGIGGGSALDAAKAVSVFAADTGITGYEDIFDAAKKSGKQLDVIAIPTTSGTGSEANGYSVMSMPDGETKRSFVCNFPKYAFLDPQYTYSLSFSSSISCALDAFAHAFESALSPKASPVSFLFAAYAAKRIWNVISGSPIQLSPENRQALQNASCAAGMAISVTGTGFPHPLGYSLTMLDGIPHGAACAVFYDAYINYNLKNPRGCKIIHDFCSAIGTDPKTLAATVTRLSGVKLKLTEQEIYRHVALISDAKNYSNSPYVLSNEEKIEIYLKLFS